MTEEAVIAIVLLPIIFKKITQFYEKEFKQKYKKR